MMVVRLDLRLPIWYEGDDKDLISKFFSSLNAKITALENRQERHNKRIRRSQVGYIWAKERSFSHNWHFHVAIFLNRDAFHVLGKYKMAQSKATRVNSNTYQRVQSAWASALGITIKRAIGLVEVPRNAVYHLNENNPFNYEVLDDLFYRLSYLAKLESKVFGLGGRNFGRSQIGFVRGLSNFGNPLHDFDCSVSGTI